MPNVVQEKNFCGPGAAANSFHWLADQDGINLGQTLVETQSELAGNMGNNNDGNWDDTEVQGKLKYIEDHDLPYEVHYTGGNKLPTDSDYVDPNGNGTARNDGAITIDWLQNELEEGQDIELMTNTHWVVLESLVHWDDIFLLSYRDDPFQHGEDTTPDEEADIDSRHMWTLFDPDTLMINIGNGPEVLQAAVAESFIPAPGSLALLALGAVVARRRRRQ